MLLDTHIWIWWLTGGGNLSGAERDALDAEAAIRPPRISAINLWEAQMLYERGRLKLNAAFETWLLEATAPGVVEILPLATSVVLEVNRLPPTFTAIQRTVSSSLQPERSRLHWQRTIVRSADPGWSRCGNQRASHEDLPG